MSSALTNTSTAKSYLDFAGLGELRGKAQKNDDQALRETAQQFEGLFIQMMLKSMRDASNVIKGDLVDSKAVETFEGMYDKEMSVQMAKRNTLGLADMLVRQLSPKMSCPTPPSNSNSKGRHPCPWSNPNCPWHWAKTSPNPCPWSNP